MKWCCDKLEVTPNSLGLAAVKFKKIVHWLVCYLSNIGMNVALPPVAMNPAI